MAELQTLGGVSIQRAADLRIHPEQRHGPAVEADGRAHLGLARELAALVQNVRDFELGHLGSRHAGAVKDMQQGHARAASCASNACTTCRQAKGWQTLARFRRGLHPAGGRAETLGFRV